MHCVRLDPSEGMGNQLSQPQKLQPEHLAEVPKVVLKENLGACLGITPQSPFLLESISPRMSVQLQVVDGS